MDLRLIDCLLKVAEFGSMSRAAEQMGLTQPTLSRRIAALEHDFGAQLLVRRPRGVTLTPMGDFLVEQSKPLLSQANLLRAAIDGRVRTQVAVGLPFSMHGLITTPFGMREVQSALIRLRIYEGFSHHLASWITEGIIDVGILDYRPDEHFPHPRRPVVREPLLLVGSVATDLHLDAAVYAEQFEPLVLVMPGSPNVIRRALEEYLQAHLCRPFEIIDVDTLPLCLKLVAEGIGHTVMPYPAVCDQLENGRLRAAPINDLFVTWALCIHEGRQYIASVQQVANRLRNFMADEIRAQRWRLAQVID